MYNASTEYMQYAFANTRQDSIKGVLTYSNGGTKQLTESDIGEGSVKITRQCVGSEGLELGEAYMSELCIGIRTNEPRYKFYGATISLTYMLKVSGTNWEEVPLGIYIVSSADRSGAVVNVKAYDYMTKLDKAWGTKSVYGTTFNLLEEIANDCEVQLAFTETQYNARNYPNYVDALQLDADSGCSTYRDAIKIICQLLGCFAIIGRDGKLDLTRYSTTSNLTLAKTNRYSLTVADYVCKYSTLSITSMKGEYVVTEDDEADQLSLTMYYADAPAWDYGDDEILLARAQNICDYLAELDYTPVDISLPSNPIFDCGDRLSLTTDDGTVSTLITNIDWAFRAPMTIKSVGINPYTSSTQQSGSSQRSSSRESGSAQKLTIYNFNNIDDITISDNKSEIVMETDFTSNYDANVIFLGSIILTANAPTKQLPITVYDSSGSVTTAKDSSGNPLTFKTNADGYVNVKVVYQLDDVDKPFQPQEYYISGKHTMTLYYLLPNISGKTRYNWKVWITANGGSVTVSSNAAIGALLGQGLTTGEAPWNGKLDLADAIQTTSTVSGAELTINKHIEDACLVAIQNPTSNNIVDAIQKIVSVSGAELTINKHIEDRVRVAETVLKQTTELDSLGNYVYETGEKSYMLKLDYHYEGEEVESTSGKQSTLYVPTTDKEITTEVEVSIKDE